MGVLLGERVHPGISPAANGVSRLSRGAAVFSVAGHTGPNSAYPDWISVPASVRLRCSPRECLSGADPIDAFLSWDARGTVFVNVASGGVEWVGCNDLRV